MVQPPLDGAADQLETMHGIQDLAMRETVFSNKVLLPAILDKAFKGEL